MTSQRSGNKLTVTADWGALQRELDRWRIHGRLATLWWRDDDAEQTTPGLDRLLNMAGVWRAPLALAVPPGPARASLAVVLETSPQMCSVLQHGYAHLNHAPPQEKKCEVGAHRPISATLAELGVGRDKLTGMFGPRFLPVMVPPWNRIDPAVVAGLCETGFQGLSGFGPRDAPRTANLAQCNTHVDIIDWRGTRGFAGTGRVLAALIDHLEDRRNGRVDAEEPTGVLTHHLQHDPACWAFMERLMRVTTDHPAAVWLPAPTVFE